ncbi:MAG: hypothetical protein COV52_01600 [Gammaproteobacteria bacterium CG11_big_fil_rev_8_21_14_0_20_46_22]|nr:MAG: hypothetical protein COW05_05495 [Gammaproteobacteria bacterium CG12_big_fil_rev_8_21_14_0_65_46_12]PIR11809.1 MAG: hypothetical protein COV52_01600 [Gammaproteobacteria bacterium CG11_big_fil_rev_8_21_14_0_20_46_22]
MKNVTKLTCAALVTAGLSLAAVQAQAATHKGMEKCYGIAKAGKNDCGGKGTGHSCQGQATKSGDSNDWLFVPKGLCDKINGGSTTRGDNS